MEPVTPRSPASQPYSSVIAAGLAGHHGLGTAAAASYLAAAAT